MSERVADLYADISIRGGEDFDQRLESGRQNLVQMGRAADSSSEQVRRAALRTSTAYQEVQKELEKAQRQARTQAQAAVDAADRERLAVDRLAETRQRYGNESAQARRAEENMARAHRETEQAARRAERATDQLTVTQRRAGAVAQQAADDMRRAGQDMESALPGADETTAAGEEGGDGFGGGFLAGAAGKLKGLAGKGGPIAAAVVGVAAIGLAAGQMLANAIAEGAEREKIQDTIQGQLGIDAESAARMGRAASEAYMDVWGESVQGNMESLRSLAEFKLIDPSASQADMERLLATVETLNGVLGTETSESLRAVNGLVKTGLADDIDDAANMIVRAKQLGIDAQGDLIDSISEYSAGWKQTGFSAEFTLGLISQSMDNGADNSDRAADSIREFGRRVVEEGDTLTQTFTDLGFNGEEMYRKFVEGGPDAEAAFDEVFDSIRKIEDPAKRAAAAQALLGDTSGDFIDTMARWDPSEASKKFEGSADALSNASKTMGDNASTTWEGMRRTVEEATMGIKQSMAEAFGPAVADMAAGLIENKDEIILFFSEIVSAALTFGIGIGNVAAGALHTLGWMSTSVGDFMGTMMETIGGATEVLGELIGAIPGMGGVGDFLKEAGQSAKNFRSTMHETGDTLHGMANTIADTVVPGLTSMRDGVDENAAAILREAAASEQLVETLNTLPREKPIDVTTPGGELALQILTNIGAKVTTDNYKNIVVESPLAPAVLEDLRRLGIEVVTNNGKTILVTSNAPVVKADIDNLNNSINGIAGVKNIVFNMTTTGELPPTTPGYRIGPGGQLVPRDQNADGSIRQYAQGGIDGSLPDQAIIQPATRGKRGLVQWAETDAGPWEAFIPGAASKRARATNILAEVADRFGYKIFKMAEGGMFDRNAAIATAQAHDDEPYVYGALDCSGYLSEIHSKGTGQQVRFTTDSDFAALGWVPGDDPNGWTIGTNNGSGENGHMSGRLFGVPVESGGNGIQYGEGAQDPTNFPSVWHWPGASGTQDPNAVAADNRTEREKIIDTVVAEGKRRGKSDKEIKSAVMATLAETDAQNLDHGMDGDNAGILQQRDSWGTREQRMDPAFAVNAYYDALEKVGDTEGMSEAQMAQAVQRSGTADGSNYAAKADEADAEIAASLARQSAAGAGSTTASGAPAGVQQVYVVGGKLDGASATSAATVDSSTPAEAAPPADSGAASRSPLR
ncbi:phage tail tape measure protein [Williamsia sp. D3]|uniref:phage tail tape measure protein n=1 Tax=Williamsia sp. D3 TaxID=1313067 RepID=UPI0003D2F579|nr:phage tail tape measure protein [Williamsia sp. D3]ETD31528.1 hypothetical protein W823_19295 [Williamsia sp. D3]